MNSLQLLDILNLGESEDLECKKSKSDVPKSLWDTYSAMANTNGGIILLGVDEIDNELIVTGVENVDKVIKDFWSTLNGNKVNKNILKNEDLEVIEIDSKSVIKINIPRAHYRDKPIFINGNPYNGTYKRNYEGDYKCTEDEVKAMIRDASEQGGDSKILEGYDMDDVDINTLRRYRNRFLVVNPDHIWNELSDEEFLKQLGAISKNRSTKEEGLTLAGLLMFGKGLSIREAYPYINLDFRDERDVSDDIRYNDRVTIDGTWENNLYNFYTIVIQKLTDGLKVPFYMENLTRIDDTLVHKAIREAFVNAIVHSDYNAQGTLKIIRYKDHYEFSNAGSLKISKEDIFNGGNSKSRNPKIQTILRLIGLGENIGSGFPTILKAWNQQHWRLPQLEENIKLNIVILNLWMVSLIPEDCITKIKEIYGNKFDYLEELEILAIVTAYLEGRVTNSRLQTICNNHPNDITKVLYGLVQKEFLIEDGYGRGKVYYINKEYKNDENNINIEMDYITEEEKQVLDFIKINGYINRSLSESELGFNKNKNLKLCKKLIEKGLIKKIGTSNKIKYVLIDCKDDDASL
ncbi:MAG: putative DNA binding domain-containing protein [Peptostreptococcaceae bacterium]|nr:putative DNA binding domain-containing protein [Peptostreptococcaceae bacterium]